MQRPTITAVTPELDSLPFDELIDQELGDLASQLEAAEGEVCTALSALAEAAVEQGLAKDEAAAELDRYWYGGAGDGLLPVDTVLRWFGICYGEARRERDREEA